MSLAWDRDIPHKKESPLVASYRKPLVAKSLSLRLGF